MNSSGAFSMAVFFAAFFTLSCRSSLDIELEDAPRIPVVNAFLTPDQARVHLSLSFNFTEDTLKPVPDARVTILARESGTTYVLDKTDDFIYEIRDTDFAPGLYELFVLIDGYEPVTAVTSLPEKTMIISGRDVSPAGYDEYGDPYIDYMLIFEDADQVENYYEVFFAYKAFDEIWFKTNYCIVTNDPSVLNTGLEKMENRTLIFNDVLFQGKQKELKIKYCGTDYIAVLDSKFELENNKSYAILRDVSESYYNFRTSWVAHSYSKPEQPPILSDPIVEDIIKTLYKPDVQPLYSNVENAYGIFVGYREQLFELEIINTAD